MEETSSEIQPLLTLRNHNGCYNTHNAKAVNFNFIHDAEQGIDTKNANIEKITFTWNEINVFALENRRLFRTGQSTQGKQILTGVSGTAHSGELLAILGSSGSGKTTLLNALTFRSSSRLLVTGLRCANGVPVNLNSLTSQSAYVQQEDLFIGSLTVKEHLIFQALVRMDRNIPYGQRMKRVEEVIAELGLNECENTLIGIRGRLQGISGGEMKRLSFASEVLTNPSLMFCDEPTSGLDAFMALSVVQVLKRMAQTGKTVVCSIHQPSSQLYFMFDKLVLMAQGRVAFFGTPKEADDFFETTIGYRCPPSYNPADYYIQNLTVLPGSEESKLNVNMICDQFEKSEFGVKLRAETQSEYGTQQSNGKSRKNNPYKASWFSQFRAVSWRCWIHTKKEPFYIKARISKTIVTALFIGYIYYNQKLNQDGVMNMNGVLLVYLMNMNNQNILAVIKVFCSELPILLRENKNGMYRTDVYFISKMMAETPLFIFIPVLYISISYYLVGLNTQQPRFVIAMGILILITHAAISFGYFVSCLSSNLSMALKIGPTFMTLFMFLGGFYINLNSISSNFKWMSYISYYRYGEELLMVNQWNGIEGINCTSRSCPKDGRIILEAYSFSESNFTEDVISLCGLIVGFRLLAYLALVVKTYTFE